MIGRSATAKLVRSACSAAARRRRSSSSLGALSSHLAPPASPAASLSGVPYSPLVGGPSFLGCYLDKGLDRRQFHSSTPLRYNHGGGSQVLPRFSRREWSLLCYLSIGRSLSCLVLPIYALILLVMYVFIDGANTYTV